MENIDVFIKECTLISLLRGNLMVELLPKKEKKNGGRVGTYINAIYYLGANHDVFNVMGLPRMHTTPRI